MPEARQWPEGIHIRPAHVITKAVARVTAPCLITCFDSYNHGGLSITEVLLNYCT